MALTRKPPRLYRLSRMLRRVGLVVLVLIIVYVATAAYSALQLHPGDIGKGGAKTTVLPDGTVQVLSEINLTNPGFYPINSITLVAHIHLPTGELLASGSSPVTSVLPASTATIPVTVLIPLTFSGAQLSLVTHDEQLPSDYWVNVSYASIFSALVHVTTNLSWGAPFYALNATVQPPIPNGNGTVSVPVEVSFQNHAGFGANGILSFKVVSPSSTVCGSGALPISDLPHAQFDRTVTFTSSPSCNPHGGTIELSFAGSPWSVTLPSEPIP